MQKKKNPQIWKVGLFSKFRRYFSDFYLKMPLEIGILASHHFSGASVKETKLQTCRRYVCDMDKLCFWLVEDFLTVYTVRLVDKSLDIKGSDQELQIIQVEHM